MAGRLAVSILFIATLLIAGLSVAAPTSTAHAKDCLAAPNSPAPEGSWWYYRLDWPTQRRCWYLRALGKAVQQTTEGTATGPARSRSAPSKSTRPTDRALKSVSPDDDTTPRPPDPETALVGPTLPEVSAPKPVIANQHVNSAPEPNAAPAISTSSEPIVEQNVHDEIITQSIPERPVQETSAPPQTNSQGVISPDVVPRIKALESGAVPTDASTPDYIEAVVRNREQINDNQIPMILFFVISVGLAAVGISSHFFVRRARTRRPA